MADFCHGPFPEADSAWLPTLGDILWKQNQGDANYTPFGFGQLVVPDDCPHVTARFDDLTERFNSRYFNRRIGAETLPRWQVRLQNRLDEIARRYEFAYSAYERYADTMLEDMPYSKAISEDYTESEQGTTERSTGGTDRSERTDRTADTPDSLINASANYADSLSESEASTSYGRTEDEEADRTLTHDLDRRERYGGGELARNVHDAIDAYRDLDTRFVREFENLFLNVFWY